LCAIIFSTELGKALIISSSALLPSALTVAFLTPLCKYSSCPVFAKIFGAKVKNGLSELLAGIISSPSEAIKKTDSEYLDIIFCGKIPPNPSELLGSESMQKYIEKWKSEYDFIILDLPPICEVADAGVVSSFVSGYVLTVRSNYSDVNEIKNAVSKIQAVNGNVLGYVINDVNIKNRAEYSNEYRKIYRRRAAYEQDSEGV
jgi:capsular exopolysaccharide synthesis family protein